MKAAERDELLVRVDEKVKSLKDDTEEIKIDLKTQNGRVSRNSRIIFIIVGILIAAGTLGGLEVADIIKLVGG